MSEVKELSRKLGRANDGTTDHNSSMGNSVAMLLGLYARKRTGKGQYILSTMLANNAYANSDDFFWHEGKPERALPDKNGLGLNALYQLYRAKGGWIFLACLFESEWHDLCRALERSDLITNSLFAKPSDRAKNDAILAQKLSTIFLSHEPLYWEKLLTDSDVACVEAEDQGMFYFFDRDPHVQETGMLTHVETKRLGKFWRYSPIVSFSHTSTKAECGPLKGQHSKSILQELGYTTVQINDLHARGVIDWDSGD
jgi:crotonobetainyl-CoA:carnitine CoA-transferase CaiB-like acyl-CoA transferase